MDLGFDIGTSDDQRIKKLEAEIQELRARLSETDDRNLSISDDNRAIRNDIDSNNADYPPIRVHASVMLFFAAEGDGRIEVSKHLSGTSYSAGRNPLNSSTERRELAKWESAVEQLLSGGYIKQMEKNDHRYQEYQLTDKGYIMSDRFKSDNQLNISMTPSEVLAMFE